MRSVNPALVVLLVSLSTVTVADDRDDCAKGRFDLRISACTKILQTNPLDFNALANRGSSFSGIGEYDRALVDLNDAMRLNPNVAGLYLEQGLARDGKGEHKLAIAAFSEALRRDTSLIVARFGRAMAYEATGQPKLSMADLDEAMRHNREMVAALYMQRGYALRTTRQYDKAVAAFDRAIDLHPNWLRAYFGRGASYEEMGDGQRAVADYRRCLEFEATTDLERQTHQMAREQLGKLSPR